jgi:hypothetical protein
MKILSHNVDDYEINTRMEIKGIIYHRVEFRYGNNVIWQPHREFYGQGLPRTELESIWKLELSRIKREKKLIRILGI